MTISPQSPRLVKTGKEGYRALAEDHLTFIDVWFGYSLEVLVKRGYVTDGASVPSEQISEITWDSEIGKKIREHFPRISGKLDFNSLVLSLIGTPWDMPRLLASIVHDALYGLQWKIRWACDMIYKLILLANDYSPARADIEYTAIRLVGWKNWNAITEKEVKETKKLTKVKWIRTKNKSKEIAKLLKG